MADSASLIHLSSDIYTGGELCVQNLLTGGSFEEDGVHWITSATTTTTTTSAAAEIQSYVTHIGNSALSLSPDAINVSSFARHTTIKVDPTHQHRVRFWVNVRQALSMCTDAKLSTGALWSDKYGSSCTIYKDRGHCFQGRVLRNPHDMSGGLTQTATDAPWKRDGEVGADKACCECAGSTSTYGNVASTDDICGVVSLTFFNVTDADEDAENVNQKFVTNITFPCRIDYSWQYKEEWISSTYGYDRLAVAVYLVDTSRKYSFIIDDVSVVPFPKIVDEATAKFWHPKTEDRVSI